ncbi:MAG: hypothetical protein EOO88_21385 [Pedobacter sp.]|nr:MAG: hypothetical protein EOO88_21385 [Pedobacter sp.]
MYLISVGLNSCEKKNEYLKVTAAEFITPTAGAGDYYLKSTNAPFLIPVGLTTVSDVDRTLNFTYTSTTAASGVQYTAPASVTIKAGSVIDTLRFKGIFSGYPAGRKDVITVKMDGYPAVDGLNTFKITTQPYCDVVSSSLIGNYTNTKDYYGGAPSAAKYTASISNWTPTGTSGTAATILIKNLGVTSDVGFGPFAATDPAATGITANLDWSNAANFTITIPSQPYVTSLYTYGASTISGTGTFSACNQTFTINYTVRVAAGNFTGTSTVLSK